MKTRLDVIREEMKSKGCRPAWVHEGVPSCAAEACPSYVPEGMGCALDPLLDPDDLDCYPMIEAMYSALSEPS